MLKFTPPQDRDARPDGALLLTLLRKLTYNTPEAVVTLTHMDAQWSAERFDPDWLAKIGVEALPTSAPSETPLTLAVEDFKRLCQSSYVLEKMGLRIAVEGKPDFVLRVLSPTAWEVEGPEEEVEALLKQL